MLSAGMTSTAGPSATLRGMRGRISGRAARLAALATVMAAGAAAAPASAHHSISGYDAAHSLVLQGTLLHAKVANPHSWFEVSVPGQGATVVWTVETGGKGYVLRAIGGVLRDQFDPGQSVSVTVHPRRDGSPNGLLMQLRFADGRVLEGIALP